VSTIGKNILTMSPTELREFVETRRKARKMQPPPKKSQKRAPVTVTALAKELGISPAKALELLEEELNGE